MDEMYGNDEYVEAADKADELHCTIRSLVWKYGAGQPVAIVWSKNDNEAVRRLTGTVVTQCQYGQKAYSVSVEYDNDHYTVRMLRHQKTVKSDYFAA